MSLYRVRLVAARVAILKDALDQADGNVSEAARQLGIARTQLIALIRRHSLSRYVVGLRAQN